MDGGSNGGMPEPSIQTARIDSPIPPGALTVLALAPASKSLPEVVG